jgi:hypothetical protein
MEPRNDKTNRYLDEGDVLKRLESVEPKMVRDEQIDRHERKQELSARLMYLLDKMMMIGMRNQAELHISRKAPGGGASPFCGKAERCKPKYVSECEARISSSQSI